MTPHLFEFGQRSRVARAAVRVEVVVADISPAGGPGDLHAARCPPALQTGRRFFLPRNSEDLPMCVPAVELANSSGVFLRLCASCANVQGIDRQSTVRMGWNFQKGPSSLTLSP